MKRVCPYCKQTNYVCVESYPTYRVESYYVGRVAELDEDNLEYEGSTEPIVYCPECETEYEGCSSVEEATKLMIEED